MDSKLHPNEAIKRNSRFLRGSLKDSIADSVTGALSPDDAQISKFHGFYEQDDRDRRAERQERFLEPYYSFMLRARLPGGVCSAEQWLAIDSVARELGNGSIRLTTPPDLPVPRHSEAPPEAADPAHQSGHDRLDRRLRRRQPQRAVQSESRALGAARRGLRLGQAHQRAPAARDPRLSRDLARRRAGRRRRVRAPVRRDLSAAQVQDCGRSSAAQRGRRLHQRPGLRRHRRERAVARLQRVGRRRHGYHPRRPEHLPAAGRRARLHRPGAGAGRGRGRADHPARLRRPGEPKTRPAEVHRRAHGTRRLHRRGGTAMRRPLPATSAGALHQPERSLRLGAQQRRPLAPDALHRERPDRRSAWCRADERAARDRQASSG